jgi:hypothetical protein
MSEDFLHYVWRFQKFSREELKTSEGLPLRIFSQGFYNAADSGPDFTQARICLDGIEWVGQVEIHLRSSDWRRHGHSADPAYANVILHVVWVDDTPVVNASGERIPTLELCHRCDPELENRYLALIKNVNPILCNSFLPSVRSITKLSMYERALVERMEIKAREILKLQDKLSIDWPQACQIWLFRQFGFKINGEAFTHLGSVISWKWLAWHAGKRKQIEALLFGLAGMLDAEPRSDYEKELQQEFQFLAIKYGIADKKLNPTEWKFLRMRPANFPTLRMAQLAAFLDDTPHTHTLLEQFPDLPSLERAFSGELSEFWQHHYHFAKPSKSKSKGIGKDSINLLIINVAVPLMFALGLQHDDERYYEKAFEWLRGLPAENNRITRQWESLGMENEKAYDSQALIGLYRHFCEPKACLQCKIGDEILRI